MGYHLFFKQIFKGAIWLSLVICFFIISSNRLIGFPIDKAMMFLFSGFLAFHYFLSGESLSKGSLSVLLVMTGLVLVSFAVNIPESSLMVFFPLVGILFAYLVSQEKKFLDVIYVAIFLHLMCGILFFVLSYSQTVNSYVHPMYDKGLPFIHAAKGFTSTVQTFGTLGITWFLIYYWKKDNNLITKWDKLAYVFAVFAIFITFNRNTLLIFYIIVFFRQKRAFLLISFFLLLFYLFFFDTINSLLFNLTTITSRMDLLQGFKIAFFDLANWKDYLFGNGNNTIPEEISRQTFYKTGYIENGTSVLLYTYGFLGYLFYILSSLLLSLVFILKKSFFNAVLGGYILLVAQQFTHEFFSASFYLLIATFLLILKSKIVCDTTE